MLDKGKLLDEEFSLFWASWNRDPLGSLTPGKMAEDRDDRQGESRFQSTQSCHPICLLLVLSSRPLLHVPRYQTQPRAQARDLSLIPTTLIPRGCTACVCIDVTATLFPGSLSLHAPQALRTFVPVLTIYSSFCLTSGPKYIIPAIPTSPTSFLHPSLTLHQSHHTPLRSSYTRPDRAIEGPKYCRSTHTV